MAGSEFAGHKAEYDFVFEGASKHCAFQKKNEYAERLGSRQKSGKRISYSSQRAQVDRSGWDQIPRSGGSTVPKAYSKNNFLIADSAAGAISKHPVFFICF